MQTSTFAAADAPPAPAPHDSVVFCRCGASAANAMGHDAATKAAIARSLAELLGIPFAGDRDASMPAGGRQFVVPSDTLVGRHEAARLGIRRAEDLFGGVVPHAFVATKVITHALVDASAPAPVGWSSAFGDAVQPFVLPGFGSFTRDDALRGGRRLLQRGAVRVKEPHGVGGAGQQVVKDAAALEACIDAIDPARLQRQGLVLERNLNDVTTLSVGQVRVGRWLATYCGTQHLTRDHRGREVYGGSRLQVVRGGYRELLAQPLEPRQRVAVEQALAYHRNALSCFDLIASRCNYDVAQGLDEAGAWQSGVLEQSWRIGGASGAEAAALHAFKDDPTLQVVHASTHEVYGEPAPLPRGARVHFDGTDAQVGRLVKYALVGQHVDA